MKILLYLAGTCFLVIPLILWLLEKYYATQDILVHDIILGAGDFQLDQRGISTWSICIGILLLYWGFRNLTSISQRSDG